MASSLIILSWEAYGLRCPDHRICFECSTNTVFPVTMIQMPNGTGKTTTLKLLRAALSGDEEKLGDIRELSKKPEFSETGFFEVRCLLDGKPYTYRMDFDFESNSVSFKTTKPAGQQSGHHVPPEFKKFLKNAFVNFFVFDGELAESLLRKDETNAQRAIDSLFHLDLVMIFKERVEEYWEKTVSNSTATENRGLARRRNRLFDLNKRLKLLQSERNEINNKLEHDLSLLEKLSARHQDAIQNSEKYRKQSLAAQEKWKDCEEKTKELSRNILDRFRNPAYLSEYFGARLIDLRLGLDRVKLPESAAREFFEELSHEIECICGRAIDADISMVIRERAANYLGTDDVSLLNTIKTAVSEIVTDDAGYLSGKGGQLIEELVVSIENTGLAKNDFDHINQQAEDDDPSLKADQQRINELTLSVNKLKDALAEYDDKDDKKSDSQTKGIDVIKRRIRDAEKLLSEVEGVIKLKAKRDILVGIFKSVSSKASLVLSGKMVKEANKKMDNIMPDNALRLEKIDKSLIIKGQGGGSVGETLAIAYSFLSSLFEHSNHKLPFVVDSPAGSLDNAVRSRVAKVIPNLTHQFIAFTISTERTNFVDELDSILAGDIQYLTLYRKSMKGVRSPRGSEVLVRTTDGVLVAGCSFFNDFQHEEVQ